MVSSYTPTVFWQALILGHFFVEKRSVYKSGVHCAGVTLSLRCGFFLHIGALQLFSVFVKGIDRPEVGRAGSGRVLVCGNRISNRCN